MNFMENALYKCIIIIIIINTPSITLLTSYSSV